eukprot:CAMPEP_0184695946 /NCGR_PEP_ID=MMETSP0313-20130426/3398_1 /TAXON_ID=2792 /ORGANISM="Porphyridium aerugineum, Strain SAG 1380-2" /LENGTH=863 /DNA_ID=CAMNT_0027154475 /DNA_START=155 /DNA_END=2746 /DNA_ORIENTATION=+
MAAVGIDYGNLQCVIALCRRGGVDIVSNEVSNRSTPSLVGFTGEQRHVGESAATLAVQNYQNTVTDLKRCIGLRMGDPELEAERARVFYEIDAYSDKDTDVLAGEHAAKSFSGAKVLYGPDGGHPRVFSYEALVGMLFSKLAETAEKENRAPITDMVISVPGYFTDIQRRAVLGAAKIADVPLIRLMNEHAAVALTYGIFRTKELPSDKPIHVAFVDMGQTQTTVAIAAVLNTSVTIKCVVFDPSLGSRDYELTMFDHFADEFKVKPGIDVRSNPKARLRLLKELEKTKKVLSANAETVLNIECLVDEHDVRTHVKRDLFEQLSAPLNQRLDALLRSAVEASGMELSALHSIELVGGGTRVPSVIATIEKAFQRPPMRTLNSDECIARGCALQAAMLSPAFKVRDYAVHDVSPYAISILKKLPGTSDSTAEVIRLVDRFHTQPALKALSFSNVGPLEILAQYGDVKMADRNIANYLVECPKPELDPGSKIRLKIRLDANGCIELASAQELKEIEVEEAVKKENAATETPATSKDGDVKMEDATAESKPEANGASPAEDAGAKMEAEPAAADGTDAASAANEDSKRPVKKVKKTKAIDLVVKRGLVGLAMSDASLQNAMAEEAAMRATDKYIRERQDAMNSLESYVYDMRARFEDGGDLKQFLDDATRSKVSTLFDETENWLYSEEAETSQKNVFTSRLQALEALCAPVVFRKVEFDERPVVIRNCLEECSKWKQVSIPKEEKYAHLTDDEKNSVLRAVEEFEAWLRDLKAKQDHLKSSEVPVLVTKDIKEKRAALEVKVRPILHKPKPAPPKVEEPAPAPAPAPTKEGGDAEMKDGESAPVEDHDPMDAEKAENTMEVDESKA